MSSPGERQDGARPSDASEWFASSEEMLLILNRGADKYGEAFLAYIILDGVEQRSWRLIEEFEATFVGYWPDQTAFVEWELRERGLHADLDEFARDCGFAPGVLRWDQLELWEQLQDRYRITERLGGVYVFGR